ncbi:PEP-CTERM sorting domain-containing protein [Luteolibacter flavescens]|uniref:PEP-CTERM sorting domain-containing protein n=1 Tax=Luteolibacter flavescens TaxID=1859460 RepID=A0ABT3FPY9_9BACT|nr:PEP-CTERM sorting domain-containing protein [Luteolibacter flavescens]MCW1885642.1 PEP-CTERM sorting domain-containing protein [Luteolibacter flavescens]
MASLFLAASASGATIAGYAPTTGLTSTYARHGISFTTADDGTADKLETIAFFNGSTVSGNGMLYLFTSAYLDAPINIEGDVGAIASAAFVAGVGFDFSTSNITLLPNTTYFAYSRAGFYVSTTTGNGYAGGAHFQAGNNFDAYVGSTGRDAAFLVTGTAVPEPGSLALVAGGLLAAAARRRRK